MDPAPDAATALAIERTWLAYDRTLMAWVRTAVSLITFGFGVYKFFQLERSGVPPQPNVLVGPREFAVVLIALGLAALGMATLQHRHALAALRARAPHLPPSAAPWLAWVVWVLGVGALLAVLLRL